MSSRKGMPDSHTAHPNVTPLIDIVMCLIIFFMLVAKIGVTTGAEAMDLPKAILGKSIEDLGNTLTLNVTKPPSGLEPMVTALVDGQVRELKFSATRAGQPINEVLEVLKAARGQNEEFKIILRSPKDMPFEYLEPVLFVSAEANVKNVNFATAEVSR